MQQEQGLEKYQLYPPLLESPLPSGVIIDLSSLSCVVGQFLMRYFG